MKRSGGLIALILFVAGVSFVLSAQVQKSKQAAEVPAPSNTAETEKINVNLDKAQEPSPKKAPKKVNHGLHR